MRDPLVHCTDVRSVETWRKKSSELFRKQEVREMTSWKGRNVKPPQTKSSGDVTFTYT